MSRNDRPESAACVANDGPTDAELAAIEAEWPRIEAELELLDAQIVALVTKDETTALAWRRLRRAERRVLTVRRALTAPAALSSDSEREEAA